MKRKRSPTNHADSPVPRPLSPSSNNPLVPSASPSRGPQGGNLDERRRGRPRLSPSSNDQDEAQQQEAETDNQDVGPTPADRRRRAADGLPGGGVRSDTISNVAEGKNEEDINNNNNKVAMPTAAGAAVRKQYHHRQGQRTQSARELTSLSATKRSRILESIHGVYSRTGSNSEHYYQKQQQAQEGRQQELLLHSLDRSLNKEREVVGKEEEHQNVAGPRESIESVPHVENEDSSSDEEEKQAENDGMQLVQEEDNKLSELEDALNRIEEKPAYNQSYAQWDGYVTDPQFRLIFLRAESYNPKKAAVRLVSFMEEKLERFGPDTLTRQLTIDDLNSHSRSLLIKKGVLQLLSSRDSSGRAIMLTYYRASQIREELLRGDSSCLGDAIFYLLSAMAEDEETQRRGIIAVCIIASNPPPENHDLDVLLQATLLNLGERVFNWCPLKCNAHHHWIYEERGRDMEGHSRMATDYSSSFKSRAGSSSFSPAGSAGIRIFDTIAGSLGKDYRVRTRLHGGGTFDECKKTLKTFGIPVSHLPFSIDGSEIRLSGSHAKWINKRRQKETELILRPFSSRRQQQESMMLLLGTASTSTRSTTSSSTTYNHSDLPSCFDVIDLPGRHDVCLGRGNTLHQHSGNVAMRSMMEPLVEEYEKAASSRRQELNNIIVKAVHLIGGNFLSDKASDGGWFEVIKDETVVEKSIGGIFRSMVSRMNAAAMMKQSPSESKIAKMGSFGDNIDDK